MLKNLQFLEMLCLPLELSLPNFESCVQLRLENQKRHHHLKFPVFTQDN